MQQHNTRAVGAWVPFNLGSDRDAIHNKAHVRHIVEITVDQEAGRSSEIWHHNRAHAVPEIP